MIIDRLRHHPTPDEIDQERRERRYTELLANSLHPLATEKFAYVVRGRDRDTYNASDKRKLPVVTLESKEKSTRRYLSGNPFLRASINIQPDSRFGRAEVAIVMRCYPNFIKIEKLLPVLRKRLPFASTAIAFYEYEIGESLRDVCRFPEPTLQSAPGRSSRREMTIGISEVLDGIFRTSI